MKGYIYKIYDNTNGNIYYGSTKEIISKRIAKHRFTYKKYLEGKFNYIKSFDILCNNDYSYCVVEEVEYENKWQLLNRERYYIENNECVNKTIPSRTQKQYYEDNKEIIKEYKKEYYQNNIEIIKQKQKEKITCECGCEVKRSNLAEHRKTKKHFTYLETIQ